ncbi:MAG: membrane protein insertase YidC [Flavobacteriia bacterium]|nr:membrane protein insertase YidC [Flavobacteriia bacterium]
MDRNTTIGLILIGLVLTIFTVINQPSQEDIKKAKEAQKKEKAETKPQKEADEVKKENAKPIQKNPASTAPIIAQKEVKVVTLENENIKVQLSSLGAQLNAVYLKQFKSYDHYVKGKQEPLCLFSEKDGNNFLYLPGYTTTDQINFSTKAEKDKVTFESAFDASHRIVIQYTLTKSNQLDYSIRLDGFDSKVKNEAQLKWYLNYRRTERKLKEQRKITTICFQEKEEGMDYLSETSDDYGVTENPIEWVAFKQSYFSAILHAEQPFKARGKLKVSNYPEGSEKEYSHIKEMKMSLTPAFNAENVAKFTWFFGPNEYNLLASYDADYDDILNYGWGIFRWINLYAVQPIFDLLVHNNIGAGIAILLLTLILKLLLMPIQWKMFVSSVKMKILKPQIEKINEKFPKKEQAMEKQSAMMGLYRDAGASPLAGCVPMLIQMPILLAVFRFFPANFDLRQQPFLWAEDLSSFDSIWDFGFNLWPYGDHMSLFTLLMAATTLIYTYMNSGNMQQPTQPGMPDMRIIMYIFPVLMIFFFNDYSSGLSYYYFISTLFTILIMLAIKRFFIDEEKLKIKMEERTAKAATTPRKKSKFQERLEEMQKKANEAQKNSKRK